MSHNQTTYGIIGYPVKHSLSPVMHNAAFEALDVEALYKLFPLEENELDDFFDQLRQKDSPIFGLNVTVPYKEKVIAYLDSLTPFAQKVMAVNTIVITEDRKLVGYNTDGPGFIAHLHELGFDPRNKRIAVLGAGGSARAVIAALSLIPERPASIKVYNRTPERIDELLRDLGARIDTKFVEPVMSIDDLNIELADLVINTTSVGLKEGDACLIEKELFHANMMVYDLIYNPAETMLLKIAKEQGAKTANGLGMLYYQGVLAFEHWAGIPLEDPMREIMRKALCY